MKTDSKALASLFDAFADQLKTILNDGRTIVDKEGEVHTITPDAASLNVIRQFLKDTGTAPAPGTNPVLDDIAQRLPFDGSEHDERHRH